MAGTVVLFPPFFSAGGKREDKRELPAKVWQATLFSFFWSLVPGFELKKIYFHPFICDIFNKSLFVILRCSF